MTNHVTRQKPKASAEAVLRGGHSKVCPLWPQCQTIVHVTSLCLTFSDANIKFHFVFMASAYSQHLTNRLEQRLALVGTLEVNSIYGTTVIIRMCPVCLPRLKINYVPPQAPF